MKEGPDISIIAALIGNPANANMLMALMAGPALTATELAQEAGLVLSTVSGHLAKLENAGLVAVGVANWHFVSVAITTAPDCVAHVRLGEGHGARGSFSAAQSSCSP